jgi:hypothetical protein
MMGLRIFDNVSLDNESFAETGGVHSLTLTNTSYLDSLKNITIEHLITHGNNTLKAD